MMDYDKKYMKKNTSEYDQVASTITLKEEVDFQ